MDMSDVAEARLGLLPPIRRARLWRLYAEDGRRFLDLWMDGGASILGAKGTGLGTAAKASIDLGLTRPLPTAWARRLERALLAAYPGYAAARFYRDPARAEAAVARTGAEALVLRPFAEYLPGAEGRGTGAARFGLPLLPCPSLLAPGVVLAREPRDAEALPIEQVPPARLSAAARALREFEAFSKVYGESLWRRSDRRLSPFFERRGPYLFPRHREEEHDAFFRSALSAGVLVSPEWSLPSLVPGDFDDGELARLPR